MAQVQVSNPLEIIIVPVLNDNYAYLVRSSDGTTAAVDPAAAGPVLAKLDELGWRVDFVLNTHHHHDHVGGNLAVKKATGCQIVGPASERDRIPGIDVALAASDSFALGDAAATVSEAPGHTLGHITFWFESAGVLFSGDVLFAMGCGRLFEGSAETMWPALDKLRELPAETLVYCGHEYTESNGRFALSVEPGNAALQNRCENVAALRSRGEPTIPFTIADELETNPFLRPESGEIRQKLGLEGAKDVDVFAAVRRLKDQF